MARRETQTPMMAQYHRLKRECPKGALLLFRLGDFYEMFFEDAQTGAGILRVALTKRGTTPMCGIPYHAAGSYIGRLLKAGRQVAICEQTEEARPGKLVERAITQILSPGAHFDERLLSDERHNYLVAISRTRTLFGVAAVDLTTGDFRVTEVQGDDGLEAEIERLQPSEIIYPESDETSIASIRDRSTPLSPFEDWVFEPDNARFGLLDHFKVASLDGFGLKDRHPAIGASGAALAYITQRLRREVDHLTQLAFYEVSDRVTLDAGALRHLEIVEPLVKDSAHAVSLHKAMNRCRTPMGARRLREWLTQPTRVIERIRERQNIIASALRLEDRLAALRESLGAIRDMERALGRLSSGYGSPKDMAALRDALAMIPQLRGQIEEWITADSEAWERESIDSTDGEATAKAWRGILERLPDAPELVALLHSALVADPPPTLKDGGVIADGYNGELDTLRSASSDGKAWIANFQSEQIQATGIPSLKVRFNNVFGYFIEVTKTHLDKVPESYHRKQTIANGERYITEELKEIESTILGADERAIKLETQLFQDLRGAIGSSLETIQSAAYAIGDLDALASFAETARLFGYCRPEVGTGGVLRIEDGRHPVLDQHSETGIPFVPNDTRLDITERQIALITGPNMAGKSTYIRQTALLTVLALAGSFVPAKTAQIDVVDRIFTRIGASDNLARGQSTFMVEMSETAEILNHATQESLVILDEIGRGTSTFDGISLAWSIVESLHHSLGAKTLFATHYHELTELSARLDRVHNLSVAVREYNDEIVFLHKIVEGGADKSYGIHVARLAGVPKTVIERAKEILRNLEESELNPEGRGKRARSRQRAERDALRDLPDSPQMDLFLDSGSDD